ncbi:hypothetical protein MAPG_08155 [Magnaporthiopsis poae ATCC 64411]|uniref:Secreted protein n=1 Tax=Magnaporthiopsis poae (strain ATCC 64411 / 73-15) TaxID=644358 RepID=A0A0C4E6L2_MAGP6|nr:hypothetical protein MAPG_08155 [Magnaporthiopsis poae ATCC 64411]
MYKSIIAPFVLLAGLVAAVPAPQTPGPKPSGHEVSIVGITFAGSGCPAGSVAGQISGDLTYLTLLYDKFIAEAGKGVGATQNRKNCQLNVKLRFPQGWQFSIFKADYRGYAKIPRGETGTCKATYYFSGESRQVSSTLTLRGPYDDNYLKTDELPVESTVWSPCGIEGLLNINSEVRVTSSTSNNVLLTVDSTDLKFTQLHYLQWQKC